MGPPIQKSDQKYTYGDYYTWPDGERWEIVDGDVYNMSPAPSPTHQELLGNIYYLFKDFFEGKKCKVYLAPFDVRLPKGNEADEDIDTVVQPDLSVICDISKLDEKGCKGAPDMVVEIVSPGSAVRDMKVKLALYEHYGVKEYWIVLPLEWIVEVYRQGESGLYGRPQVYGSDETIKTGLFPSLKIGLDRVFPTEEGEKKSDGPQEHRL